MDRSILVKRKAQKLARNGQIRQACEEMRKLLGDSEVDPYDHVYLGDLLLRVGETDEALDAWQEAVASYEKVGLYRNAIAICKKILRLDVRRSAVHRSLGDLYLREGLASEALDHFLVYLDAFRGAEALPPDFDGVLDQAAAACGPTHIEAALRLSEHFARIQREDRAAELLQVLAISVADAGTSELSAELEERVRQAQTRFLLRQAEESAEAHSEAAPGAPAGPDVEVRTEAIVTSDVDEAADAGSAGVPAEETGPDPDAPSAPAVEPDPRRVPEPAPEDFSRFDPGCIAAPDPVASSGEGAVPDRPTVTDPKEGNTPSLVEQADEALASERWEEARRLCEQVLRERPLDAALLDRLVLISRRLGDQAAEVHYLTLLGDAWIEEGEFGKALPIFLTVLHCDPQNSTARRRLARFREMGVPGAEQVPMEGPGPVAGVLETGGAYVSVAEDGPARAGDEWVDLGSLLEEFRAGIKKQIDGDDFQSHYDLALSDQAMGLYPEALEETALIAGRPDIPVEMELAVRELRGRCLSELGRHEEAVAEFREALARTGEDPARRWSLIYRLGCALEAAEEWKEAAESFKLILREHPGYLDAEKRRRACLARAQEKAA